MGRTSQELAAELSPSNRLRRLQNVAGQTEKFGLRLAVVRPRLRGEARGGIGTKIRMDSWELGEVTVATYSAIWIVELILC